MWRDGLDSGDDVRHVGLAIFVEWSGHANNDGIHLGDASEIGCRGEAVLLGCLDLIGKDAHDVGRAIGDGLDLLIVNIEASDGEFLLAVEKSQRQSDIAQADDSDLGGASLHLAGKLVDV